MQDLHRLLQRQLKKYIPDYSIFPGGLTPFIEAVNQSYNHFEGNHLLIERAMRLSSDELSETNLRLRQESEHQQIILQSLQEAIHAVSPGQKLVEDNDLLKIVDILKEEIEKRRALEADLVKAREAAELSLNTKRIFLANISHEIRTPINAIVGMSGLMAESDLSSVQRDYLEAIRTSAEGLMFIINDVLDMSKLESGKFTLEKITFRLDQMLSALVNIMSLKAEEKGIQLSLNRNEKIVTHLVGDPTRINQVLSNLLSNAVKFTNFGSVQLDVALVFSGKKNQTIKFTVKDTGVGIANEKMQTIFEQFTQEDASITRKYGGTGLGLSISRQLVEMMGGILHVKSVKGEGSEFCFELTFAKGKASEEKKLPQMIRRDLRSARVLIVEDNDLNRYLATTILKNWNCRTETARHGLEAINKLEKSVYDLVLLDLQMPEMDGFQTVTEIRNKLALDVPIIALTANALESERARCIGLGMNDYVSKPFNPEGLFEKIQALLSNRKTNEMSTKPITRYSLDRLRELYMGNDLHLNKTIEIFLDQSESDMKLLSKMLEQRRYEEVKAIAHKMKPNVELFCIEEARNLLPVIEEKAAERNPEALKPLAARLSDVLATVSTQLRTIEIEV